MRRHLNTLYITTQGAWLNKDGANVVVSLEGTEKGRVPIHTIGGIVNFGRVSASPQLMGYCADEKVAMTYLTEDGRFLARVVGAQSGNVFLRREQYRRADNPQRCGEIVRGFVVGKVVNQRTVLRRSLRDHATTMTTDERSGLERVCDRLSRIAEKVETKAEIDELRGLEGEAANLYFSVFDHLIRGDRDSFRFTVRSRRPPLDRMNALLSFLYVLLMHDVRAALESQGLDPAVGFLHRDRPGRASLALDLMEEFRPFLADRLALTLINRRQLSATDFKELENGAVLLNDGGRKTVLVAYQERKREEIAHPFLEEKATIGLLWFLQAQLLARHLRGDIDGYPPLISK